MFSILLGLALTSTNADPKPLLVDLTTNGLNVPGARFKFPAPEMKGTMTLEQKKEVIKKYAKEFPRGLFEERGSASPIYYKIKNINGSDGKRKGHHVHVVFIAYGKIADLDNKDMLGSLMGVQGKGGKGPIFLEDKDLNDRKIERVNAKGLEEKFVVLDGELIEKVQLGGVLRSQKSYDNDALVAAMDMDERFVGDKEYPNQSKKIKFKGGERAGFEDAKPYSGFGGYVKATPVQKDMLFIEMQFALAESPEWFEGRNLLPSKFGLAITSNVRTLRTKLGK
jgi:hypothetical protein